MKNNYYTLLIIIIAIISPYIAIPSARPANITVFPSKDGFSLIAPTALYATTATAIPEPIADSPIARAAAINPKPDEELD